MPAARPCARAAVPDDADELLRLRVAILNGEPHGTTWRTAFRDDMRRRLGSDPDLFAFVTPAPDGSGLAACAIGVAYQAYGGPTYPDGLWARVHTVVTDRGHRRRGHGRAVTAALVAALRGRGCGSIELRATPDGIALYSALGFDALGGYMVLRPGSPGWAG
ncbi:GNAT family N-acetyltransferase [Streptomyces venezuelae]|uniref:GNAT family N-acetyltransferase n=1 Tax=Streptomyces venezuelae TaxID=54571 RepID=A0A5P2DFS6_STRVZ|nr:GNAT family N-acetyltransferase [Streptomyces venezuelae]QES51849.1 GNAT family N-acetyltransferase [Streptomyces venezuelae]